MKLVPIPEYAVRRLADQSEPDSAAHKILAEAAEIRSRGNQVRFMLTDSGELCIQEGIMFLSTEEM